MAVDSEEAFTTGAGDAVCYRRKRVSSQRQRNALSPKRAKLRYESCVHEMLIYLEGGCGCRAEQIQRKLGSHVLLKCTLQDDVFH